MRDEILVTGATGHVGGSVLAQLAGAGVRVRALARDPDRLARRLAGGLADGLGDGAAGSAGVRIVQGDLADADALARAVDGVAAVFLMWPFPTAEAAPAVVEVIREHVGRVVLLSSAAVDDRLAEQDNPIGRVHAEVERPIVDSPLEWTFLRPYAFATNTLQWARQIRAEGVVRWVHGHAAPSMIHERDIAAVAVRALTEEGHAGRKYELTGSAPVTQIEQVRTIGEVIGRPLRWEEIPREAAREQLLGWLGPDYADVVLNGYAWTEANPGPVTTTVEDLTGRPARSFREWAEDHADDFR
ncbi:uncharacterized protein YbjT (DUF2867 family) [Allostreptomyces psammosilenae]|uniref:Uncharacterized protein YbjT (DUF2867 family) n=1 Tax=Allostreptomyces psammosilenae TaxID=1892865 RepID=A0A853A4D4_9ACTN|nr:uncharacterized protein YbjT (DUF2867 family) [Allostreptomyces psammosilenae]